MQDEQKKEEFSKEVRQGNMEDTFRPFILPNTNEAKYQFTAIGDILRYKQKQVDGE